MTRRSRFRRFAARIAVVVFALCLAGAATGYVTQRRLDARILAEHPAPGSFVDVGGHRLHYTLTGAGDVTFVLEAGLGDYSGAWGEYGAALAELGRVFAYDRAGLGWSEPGPGPATVQRAVAALHRALANAGVPGPYVLVGHSMGGAMATLYAMEHPDQVAGLLLIDPSHRDQVARLAPPPFLEELIGEQVPRTASIGLARVLFGSADAVRNSSHHIAAIGAEIRAIGPSVDAWTGPVALGNTPVYVLTAGRWDAWPGETEADQRAQWEIWRSLHAELVASSSSPVRRHVLVEGAGHYIHEDAPELVLGLTRELVERIGLHAGG